MKAATKSTYSCKVTNGYFSNICNEHEKTCWLTREVSEYETESVLMHLGSRSVFISVYINNKDATGILHPTSEQLLKLLGSELSLEDTFEYCRKTFCSALSKIDTKPKNKPLVIAQPDLFDIA